MMYIGASINLLSNYLQAVKKAGSDSFSTVKRKINNLTSDRSKSLVICAVYNIAVGTFVAYSALTNDKKYNRIEWWSDVAIHYWSAGTCALEAIVTKDSPKWLKSAVQVNTKLTRFLNAHRLEAIPITMFYNTQTIPTGAEIVDIWNHKYTGDTLASHYLQ